MKYLIVLVVVLVGAWVWRSNRRAEHAARRPPQAPKNQVTDPQDMVRCAHCGLHLPRNEALASAKKPAALYCSVEHRASDNST